MSGTPDTTTPAVTEEDRAKAGRIIANWMVNFSADQPDALANMIATALAAERGKAAVLRADVRAALETYNGQNPRQALSRVQAVLAIADGQR